MRDRTVTTPEWQIIRIKIIVKLQILKIIKKTILYKREEQVNKEYENRRILWILNKNVKGTVNDRNSRMMIRQ